MPIISRRSLGLGAAGAAALAATRPETAQADHRRTPWSPPNGARFRVISDNDYSGDPDGLFQLAHAALSPSIQLETVIGSHLAPNDPFDPSSTTADNAARKARELLRLVSRRAARTPVVAGSNTALADRRTPIRSAGARAIVTAAMESSSTLPLFVTLGAGLTELASAWLIEPRISQRLTAVWIGGPEHAGHGSIPPGGTASEYNANIDRTAAQVVFNDSDLPLWQIPRNAYRQALVSMTELEAKVRPTGRLGSRLCDELDAVHRMAGTAGLNMGETYIIGDNPLVLVTALQSSFEADASSSESVTMPCPRINDEGTYETRADGRPIRVFTRLDTDLMLRDLEAKLRLHR